MTWDVEEVEVLRLYKNYGGGTGSVDHTYEGQLDLDEICSFIKFFISACGYDKEEVNRRLGVEYAEKSDNDFRVMGGVMLDKYDRDLVVEELKNAELPKKSLLTVLDILISNGVIDCEA